jgi:hypothetical protein
MNDLDLNEELGDELAEAGLVFEALTNPNAKSKYVKENVAVAVPVKTKIWAKADARKGMMNGLPYDGHNIPITKSASIIEVSLILVYRNLQTALVKFNDLGNKMIKFYAGNCLITKAKEIAKGKEFREHSPRYKSYDFSVDIAKIEEHIKFVNEYRVGDGKGGIIDPAEETIDRLDEFCVQIDSYMYSDNSIMIAIFDLILRNKLTIADIKEYEIFYKNLYLPLCEAVKKFYVNVIETIGEDADYEHSPDFVVEYFKRKGIAHKASTCGIIPMTKNMFGESLHIENASGDTVTGKRVIDKTKFESKVVGQQSFENDFKKEMEKFVSGQK